tara:strand:- start:2886 stop:3212 length:327 start_codon:yes stop_codon:yes gene_type:complete
MATNPSPWHSDLESSISNSDFDFPYGYELRWSPLPPFDDWIIHVSSNGHDAAVIVTANQMSISEQMIIFLKENAAGRLMKIIATPEGRIIEEDLLEMLSSSSIGILRY